MTEPIPQWIPNITGLAGMLMLAVPAIRVNAMAGVVASIHSAARHEDTDQAIQDIRDTVLADKP